MANALGVFKLRNSNHEASNRASLSWTMASFKIAFDLWVGSKEVRAIYEWSY
jgi:hypothetical protein